MQIDDVELLYAGLSPLNELISAPADRFYSQLGEFPAGVPIQGYTRNKFTQLQFTGTKVFGPNNWFHADQIATVGETEDTLTARSIVGALIMTFNLWMTVRHGEREAAPRAALQPAE